MQPEAVAVLSQTHIRLAEVVSTPVNCSSHRQNVVDPRHDWYTLCVTSGLGKFEPAKRKNATSAISSSLPSWIEPGPQTQVAVSETDTKPTQRVLAVL